MTQTYAAEHGKGRILLIGTTDLDVRRPVIWNIGKVAASGSLTPWNSSTTSSGSGPVAK